LKIPIAVFRPISLYLYMISEGGQVSDALIAIHKCLHLKGDIEL